MIRGNYILFCERDTDRERERGSVERTNKAPHWTMIGGSGNI